MTKKDMPTPPRQTMPTPQPSTQPSSVSPSPTSTASLDRWIARNFQPETAQDQHDEMLAEWVAKQKAKPAQKP